MLITNTQQVNFSNYKRFFTIGCSFTRWYWPTWANILSKEYPELEFYNFGRGGAGNVYISTLLSQIDRKYKLCETDLVAIMWSSFHRHTVYCATHDIKDMLADSTRDFYSNKKGDPFNWFGNSDLILVSTMDDKTNLSFDDRGYLLRDCAIIDNVSRVLAHAKFDSFQMMSVDLADQNIYDPSMVSFKDDVLEAYADLRDRMIGPSLMRVLFEGETFKGEFKLKHTSRPEKVLDNHPNSQYYAEYLKVLGFNVSDETLTWAKQCDDRVRQADSYIDIEHDFAHFKNLSLPF